MKHFRTIMTAVLLTAVLVSPAFASGAMEKTKSFNSLDMNSASAEEVVSSWDASVESYQDQRTKLRSAMDEAVEKMDVDDYLELRSIYNALSAPTISKDINETLVNRIVESDDEEEKSVLAAFLYKNSRWYQPHLVFEYTVSQRGGERVVSKSYTFAPETEISAPNMEGEGIFLGWSEDGESVKYKAGDIILAPYTDTTLKAIFSYGITFRDTVTGLEEYIEGNEAVLPILEDTDDMTFLGWYGRDGRKVEGESVTIEKGRCAEYTALWAGVEIGDAEVVDLERNSEVKVSFPVSVKGNGSIRSYSVSLEGEDVRVYGTSIRSTTSGDESTINASFRIRAEGENGEEKTVKAIVKDGRGNSWSKEITFTL